MHPYNNPKIETPGRLAERLVCEALAKEPTPEMRQLERSLAYLHASSVIDTACMQICPIGATEDWYNLDRADVTAATLAEEVAYLESRGLIDRHACNPRWIFIRPESEARQ